MGGRAMQIVDMERHTRRCYAVITLTHMHATFHGIPSYKCGCVGEFWVWWCVGVL